MNEQIWQEAAKASIAAGVIPMPLTRTVIELLQTIMDEKEAEFISVFTKPMNIKEIKEKSNLSDEALEKILDGLMYKGVITGIPSKSTGAVVYRLQPPLPGLFEYTLMRGGTSEKEKKLAGLFDKLYKELSEIFQNNYDLAVDFLKTVPPITRVVPVEQEVEKKIDDILPYEDVKMIINKFDKIAVSTCYCRHEKDLLGKPCHFTKERENCLSFGQTAEFVIKYNFGKKISKDEAFKIMDKAREDGLVHKAFHVKQDVNNEEFAICNCCKCCCPTFHLYYIGGAPMQSYSSCIARVDSSECTGCGACEDMCPMETISLVDDIAVIDEKKCIGCGVCSYHCPASAIKLEETGVRSVFVPPARRSA
jgi:NAD-dependent dihydropyrimidine dehydrogenase PreA subunit/DNA-binding MarR family transcriptional regulator